MPVFAVNNQLTYTHKLVITFSSTQYKKQNKEQSKGHVEYEYFINIIHRHKQDLCIKTCLYTLENV